MEPRTRAALRLLLLTAALAATPARGGITVEIISPAQWGQPDSALGLDGGVVEDFEDTQLAAGLLVEIADATGGFTGEGTATLPAVFDPVAGDPFGDSFAVGVWDGSHVLVNTVTNQSQYYGSDDWRPVALQVPAGTAWIALACQQVTVSHLLQVNGQFVDRLGVLGLPLGPGRNGVLIVRSDDPEEPIVSVSFGGRGDAFVIDHVVFAPAGAVAAETKSWDGVKALYRP